MTTEKILPRAIVTKKIATDAVTANEAEFGVTVVTDTEPTTFLKEGTTWVNPDDGATQVYSTDINDFVLVTDAAASAAANDAYDLADTKNTVYRQDDAPTGGTYKTNDVWIDTNDNNQLYVWNGTTWVTARDGNIATAQSAANAAQSTANGKNTVYYSTSAPGSTPNTAGDIWFQYSSGIIVAQFSGAGGTSWTSTTIGNAVIANLDAGKITTGILNVAGTVKIATNTSGSRVELNPTGFFAYNGSTPTVQILSADGSASFTGTITASTVTGSTFTTPNWNSPTNGKGGIAIVDQVGGDTILFSQTTGGVSNNTHGAITSVSTGITIAGPASTIALTTSGLISFQAPNGSERAQISSSLFSVSVTSQFNGTANFNGDVNYSGLGQSVTASLFRNISAKTASGAPSNSSGIDGDIVLVREA